MAAPTRYHFTGNVKAGMALTGFGRKQLRKLESNMKFTGAKAGKDRPIRIGNATVSTSSEFGKTHVYIHVPEIIEEISLIEEVACFCNCNFSIGFVIAVTSSDEKKYDYIDLLVCNEDKYVTYETVIGTDFVEWEEFQKVWVIPYYEMEYNCATRLDTEELPTGCEPYVMPLKEDGTAYTPDDDEWRPTYRIISVCNETKPKWL